MKESGIYIVVYAQTSRELKGMMAKRVGSPFGSGEEVGLIIARLQDGFRLLEKLRSGGSLYPSHSYLSISLYLS